MVQDRTLRAFLKERGIKTFGIDWSREEPYVKAQEDIVNGSTIITVPRSAMLCDDGNDIKTLRWEIVKKLPLSKRKAALRFWEALNERAQVDLTVNTVAPPLHAHCRANGPCWS